MLSQLSFTPPEWLSLDGVAARGERLWEYARHDPAGFAFVAAVWAASLVATFLFLRVLFTRWGDTHITRKTLALSLLLHSIVAMMSTRWDLPLGGGRGSGDAPQTESVVKLGRRNIVDMAGTGAAELTRAGRGPVWEEAPAFQEQTPSRLPKESAEPEIAHIVPEPSTAEPAAIVAAPPLPAHEVTPVIPAPERTAARLTSATIDAPQIAEPPPAQRNDTAEPAQPKRAARMEQPGVVAEISPDARVTTPTATVPLPAAAPIPASTPEIAATPEPIRQPTATTPTPAVEPKPGPPIPAGEIAATSEASGVPSAPGPAAAKAFSRVTRPGQTVEQPAPAAPAREGTPVPEIGTLSISRSTPAELPATEAAPRALRSDTDGAVSKGAGGVPAPYSLRGLPERKSFALDMGATEESEKAVQLSLQWLARHQNPAGYWPPIESTLGHEPPGDPPLDLQGAALAERQRSGYNTETGLTALALLAFLGANYTHENNAFADNVGRGLRWIISQQDKEGFLGGKANKYGRMYCHGMATIALGEAYGMTKDPALRGPLERAVQYIVVCQNRGDGGWRYAQGYRGDMSMFGWQLMALKSARTAGLDVPDETFDKAIDFLVVHGRKQRQSNQSKFGGLAGYRVSVSRENNTETVEPPKPSMTAESLFCKQMLGIDRKHPSYNEAIEYLQANLPRRARQDLYYWYYGTLAMYQHGGDPWRRWNDTLRDALVADQRSDGDFAGSWNPRAPWGDFGGRVFSTSLSTLCLEVYYRFLPLYQLGERFDEQAARPTDR